MLEIGFPDKVRYNQRATGDEIVRITVKDPENPIVKGFLEAEGVPLWWLEGSSYPIEILDKENVKVLVYSNELKEKYGESPVIIEFEHGEGKVIHMISHFYLQRSETRDNLSALAFLSHLPGQLQIPIMDVPGCLKHGLIGPQGSKNDIHGPFFQGTSNL